ncbi:hypothetical protein [Mycobacterium sp. Marseille-P9652]|uniref:hypothetical protein n=1 Tax=Mycobacterium sp. Marseille-P9652 TaxID=2654950 RepID=UPI0012E79BB1|nr:hypothetical protein [Mycobacterium sp. Marseille-P9652]
MTTLVRYNPRGIDIDLAELPAGLYNEIVSLHGHIDPPPAPAVLTCLGNGEPMYVYRHHTGRFYARHYPGGNSDGHCHRITTMSDEHRRQAEYTCRAAAEAGLPAVLEKSTGNGTRLDVAVSGLHDVGFEVQRSQLSRARAKVRAMKSFEAGWPTAWVSDTERDPDWADHVPTARLTVRGWDVMPPANSARVIIGKLIRERDGSRPSGWWYRREPTAVLLDELAVLMPAGEIVAVATGAKGQVSLAYKEAIEVIDSCAGPGASLWKPDGSTPRQREIVQAVTRECTAHPTDRPAVEKRAPLLPAAPSAQPPPRRVPELPEPEASCSTCHQPLWAPISRDRGICEACWQRERRGA